MRNITTGFLFFAYLFLGMTVGAFLWRAGLGATYLPMAMTDGVEVSYTDFESGFSPTSRLDQAILATRKAVFPELGLDPGI